MSNSDVVGQYDYIQPGKLETWNQKLTINADGTGSYWEKIENKTSVVTREGRGTWKIEDSGEKGMELYLQMRTLKKVTKSKLMQIVPGLGDSTKEDNDVIIGILVEKLSKAPASSSNLANQWRRI